MILDNQSPSPDQGIISYPDWAYALLPRSDIQETVTILAGGSQGAQASIQGTADQGDNQ